MVSFLQIQTFTGFLGILFVHCFPYQILKYGKALVQRITFMMYQSPQGRRGSVCSIFSWLRNQQKRSRGIKTGHIISSTRILFFAPSNDFTSITALAWLRRSAAITGIKSMSPSPTGLWVSFFRYCRGYAYAKTRPVGNRAGSG